MAQTIQQALSSAKFYTDDTDYVVIKLPPNAITAAAGVIAEISEPFSALIIDKDEVSIVIPDEAWQEFQKRLAGASVLPSRYRLITLDVVLEPELVGFMAHISAALAKVNISLLPLAAFSRDHLLVPADALDAALNALRQLRD
jgi:hypothetical protein